MNQATDRLITLTGRVVSDKMDKTIVVEIVRHVKHRLYKKYVRRTAKIHAHDADNSCGVGDLVTVRSVRPVAKTKAWALHRVEEKAA